MNDSNTSTDGRHARRVRSREAVVDAVFGLIADGKIPPTPEMVAERAGVSVSSVFRNFDGLADLQRQAFDEVERRYAHLVDPPIDATADRATRIREHVRSRISLYTTIGPLMHVARHRALDYAPMADGVAAMRTRFAAQTQRRFSAETQQLTPTEAANLSAAIDSMTSLEAFETMTSFHSRTPRQIARIWNTALGALIAGWITTTTQERHQHDETETP